MKSSHLFFFSLSSALQQEVADTESQGDQALYLPPCKADADTPENVYPFDDRILHSLAFLCKIVCVCVCVTEAAFQYQYFPTVLHAKKYVVCPNKYYVKCCMPEVPGCPTSCGQTLQYASQHAFLVIWIHYSVSRGKCHSVSCN